MLLDSLALSRINYALPVWGPAISKQAVSRLQCLQNRAVRITKSLSKHDHVPSIHIVPDVLSILQIWIDVDCLLLKTFFDIVLHTGGINFQIMLSH